MSKVKLAPDSRRRRYSRWLHLVLAGTIAFGWGMGQGVAVAGDAASRPIPSKSANRAALKDAAQAILENSSASIQKGTGTLQSGPVVQALPTSDVDETAVPHYFGPFPNWANSPFTLPDATVFIDGDGGGAEATATVGANGVVTGITVTNPGSGYTWATPEIVGAGTGAAAAATVTTSGVVTSVTVDAPGAGYTAPVVAFTSGTGPPTPVQVGNPLIARVYASDGATNSCPCRTRHRCPSGHTYELSDLSEMAADVGQVSSMPMSCARRALPINTS